MYQSAVPLGRGDAGVSGRNLPDFEEITCILQVISGILAHVKGQTAAERRSECPVSLSLEIFGDRWSLLIIRDLMVRGYRTFSEFHGSGEGIATNILKNRLQKLKAARIIRVEKEESDARKVNYRLTKKGIDLAPVLLELLIWGARYEGSGRQCDLIVQMEGCREQVLEVTRRRWRERDSTPIIPRFDDRQSGDART